MRLPTSTPVAVQLPIRAHTIRPTLSPAPATVPAPAIQLDALSERVFELTNAQRAQQGLRPLHLNQNLISSASWFANDLAARQVQTLVHTDSLGRDAPTRMLVFGYHWLYYAENIARGYPSPDAVVAAWMSSPGHWENLLNPKMTEIGIGHAAGGGQDYWAQDFGTR